jgi:hypothetical protein
MKPYHKVKSNLSELNEIESYEIKETESHRTSESITQNNTEPMSQKANHAESNYMKLIAKDLKYIKNFLSKTEKDEELLLKWNFAAATLDRLFLIIACLYTFITFLAIIATNKNYYGFA